MQTEPTTTSKRADQNRILDAVMAQIGNLAEFATEYGLDGIDRQTLLETLDNAAKRACGPTRWDVRLAH